MLCLLCASEVGSPTNPPWAPGSARHGVRDPLVRSQPFATKGTLAPSLVAAWSLGSLLETPPRWHVTMYIPLVTVTQVDYPRTTV